MQLSQRVVNISESITLKLNAKANQLADEGKKIYNLTAGQLPFRPPKEFVEGIRGELDFLRSFQYSPVPGTVELREKLLDYFQTSRGLNLEDIDCDFGAIVGNGGKHVLANIFASIIDPGDEVILITPFWISYPEMIKLNGGVIKELKTTVFNAFVPSLEELDEMISDKTKAIVINSPNNPSGTHYSDDWMKGFAELLLKHEHVNVISDEIYYELSYFDPAPTYFYQHKPELLERTIVVDGISKNIAATGLRLGFCIAQTPLIKAMTGLQGHTASGSCSLIQKALEKYDMGEIKEYLFPIKSHLRENSMIVREMLREMKLAKCWYQTQSAFYFLIDFSQCPIIEKFQKDENDTTDYSAEICELALEQKGLAMVPGGAFGVENCARISLVSPKETFSEAMTLLSEFLVG